ncbi:ABC transporter permease [Paenibacillus shunpengii]|uniref:ABC transporter permease n=1 Tax=Paenibacillus shunpengii TaxID=2054424 RepID=A0ABW5SR12_9BACL|nr:ABC transporter permease [Paenibacillus sp. FSL H7-0326]OMC67180.1 peptide ABC transporter permease [Paenibacillus sp. FSL H7-0326]
MISDKPIKIPAGNTLRRYWTNPLLATGTILISLVTLASLLAPWITSHDPLAIDTLNRLKPPSGEHIFGTDNFGRDVYARVMYGLRVSLMVGGAVTLISGILGLLVGLLSAYYSLCDHILMRICDGLYAFPSILLAISIVAIMGPRTFNVIIALSIVYIPSIARIVRSAALVIKEKTYIEGLRAQGAGPFRIIGLHILPNVLSPLIVQASFIFAVSILTEASLSFLGAGIPAPSPSLGNLLLDGKNVIFNAWWMTVYPGTCIILMILGLNLLGDGLRDFLDPKTKARKRLKKNNISNKTGRELHESDSTFGS